MKPAVRTMLDEAPREVNRRSFFKTLGLGAAGAMALTGPAAADAAADFVQAGVKRASEPSALKITDLRTAVIVGAPFHPIMPSAGLDPSWMYAINQAVADGLSFGSEVIFIFGPYGGIYTQMFHPGTDALVMSVGVFFGICLGAVCFFWREAVFGGASACCSCSPARFMPETPYFTTMDCFSPQ